MDKGENFMTTNNIDDAFAQYAEDQERAANSRGTNQSFHDDTKWTGMETGIPKIVRVVGGPPESKYTPGSCIKVTKARIKADDGKMIEVWKPSHLSDSDYILNKIINRVTRPSWQKTPDGKSEKIFPVQQDFPEIFNTIEKNNLNQSDPQYRFDRGWKGTEVLIMNVIDRAQMDWHRKNKHTMLLAKSINEDSNGNEYVDKGVSAFAVQSRIGHLFKSYGSWEHYDIAFVKTGRKDNPYNIINATQSPLEVDKAYQSLISTDTELTDEEKSWEQYDLSKKFAYTSATKLYNRLQHTIKKIDAALGTDFYDELRELAEKERKERADQMVSVNSYTSPVKEAVNETEFHQPDPPVRTREIPSSISEEWKNLPFGDTLSDDMKSKVKSVKKNLETNSYDIEWDMDSSNLCACPQCSAVAPYDVTQCPSCGLEF